jgi:hypothetical protein
MELESAAIEGFREAFERAAREQIPAGTVAEPERIDAVVGAEALDL